MTIDPAGDRAVYRQLADVFRHRITTGAIAGGTRLPSETSIGQDFGVGRETVRKAMAVLRAEGLVTTVQGEGTLVRQPAPPRSVRLSTGDWATVRMPVESERRRLGLDEGVPVVELHRGDGRNEVHPADNTRIVTG